MNPLTPEVILLCLENLGLPSACLGPSQGGATGAAPTSLPQARLMKACQGLWGCHHPKYRSFLPTTVPSPEPAFQLQPGPRSSLPCTQGWGEHPSDTQSRSVPRGILSSQRPGVLATSSLDTAYGCCNYLSMKPGFPPD